MTPEERSVVERLFPVTPVPYTIRPEGNVGFVIVDPVVGFTRRGNLADPDRMVPMVLEIFSIFGLMKEHLDDRLHTLVFMDSHESDIPEPPYPPHCIRDTDEELLDPGLAFLAQEPSVGVIQKDCINGFVGAMTRVRTNEIDWWTNEFVDWVIHNEIRTLVFTGDCTDICVSDLVVTCLSARNHGMFTNADPDDDRKAYVNAITGLDIVVFEDACATFDTPGHDHEAWHHVGLAMMSSRGAIIASELIVPR